MNEQHQLDVRSERNMAGIHPRLRAVVARAHATLDGDDGLSFIITEGLRSQIRQAELFKAGASRTMNSRHLIGEAVDLAATVNGEVRWAWPLYSKLNVAMQAAAHDLGVVLTWGGIWKSFPDGCHWQIESEKAQT